MQILTAIFVVIIATGLQTQICAINGHINFDFEHHIRKRSLEKDGFTDFQFATVKFSYNSDIKHKHSRELRDTEQQLRGKIIELQLAADDIRFEFVLSHAKAVVNDDTRVRVFDGNKETQALIPSPDCVLSGSLKGNPDETAIISYCNGLRGTFSDGGYSYHIEPLDSEDRGVEETVFIARIEKPFVYDTYEHLNESINYNHERHKRAILGTLEIETVLILDAEYVARMRANGHSTNQSLVDLMAMKWAGVQAEWGRATVLKYDITISIVEIMIWETNPNWYSASTVLESTLSSLCTGTNSQNLWANADHIHLFTGRSGTDVAGRAYTGDICVDGRKCAVSTHTHEDEYVIPAHELGHSMGMAHDVDVGCPAPNDGIMGSKTASWSTCSVAAMNLEVAKPESSCLTTDDVTSANAITLQEAWPGMVYTDDEICEFKYGPGFRIKSSRTSCSGDRCMNMDPNSPNYTVSYYYPTPTDGSYCGPQMVCSTQITNNAYHCISWNDTGLDLSLFTVVAGGWSAWGTMSSCSRTCGAGLKYRRRTCDNPKPQNSPWCEGDEYDAELCNTQLCVGDSNIESTLITQRAGETCTLWKTNNLYAAIGKISSNYLNTGDKYGNTGDDQCEVKCNTIAGYTATGERHGIMPDGTPCSHASLSSYEEVNNLPRQSGMYGLCLNGFCTLFGCDNVKGNVSKDGCGVCGGDNSTCQIMSGVYTTILAAGSRGTVATLPTGSSLMKFYFTYTSMVYNFLELRSKDNVVVISFSALDTTANPVHFAGTYWYLLATKQYLYAEGPIDQPVTITLYNYLNNNNTGVNYAYSTPTAAVMAACSNTCANGGTYNTTICSCRCPTGYYGNTCSTQCSKVCKNSMVPTSTLSNCQCNCLNNTYGATCNCKYPFTGIDCHDCKKTTCLNGGTFNATACRCSCPPGYGDLDCSTPCEDKGGAAYNCSGKASLGQCTSQNEAMEANCYLTCGLCTRITTTTSTSTTPSTTSSTTTTSSTSPTTASTTPSTASTTSSTASTTSSTASTTPSTASTTPSTASTTPSTASTTPSASTASSTDSTSTTSTSPSTASTSSSTTSPTTTTPTTTAPAPTTSSTATTASTAGTTASTAGTTASTAGTTASTAGTTASTAATTANTGATTTLIPCPEQFVECGGADSIFVQLSTYIGMLLLHLLSKLHMRFY